MTFVATKKGRITNFFSPLSFVADFGSEIRDGQKIRIQDKHPGSATLRTGNIFLYCLTLCRRYKDSAHLNVLLISIEQLLGSNQTFFSVLFDPVQEVQGLRPPERPPHIHRAAPRLKPSHHHHSQGQN